MITILLLVLLGPMLVGMVVNVAVHGMPWRKAIRFSLCMTGMLVAMFSSVIGVRQLPSLVGFLFQIPAAVGLVLVGRFFRKGYLLNAIAERKQLQAIAASVASDNPADRLAGQMELDDREEKRVRDRRRGFLFTVVMAVAGVVLGNWPTVVWGVAGAGFMAFAYRPKKGLLPQPDGRPRLGPEAQS